MRSKVRLLALVIGSVALLLLVAVLFFRARIADGGPPGARNVRTLSTAEYTYSSTCPDQGYAPNLATLGPDRSDVPPYDNCHVTSAHACLIDPKLGCSNGTGLAWCADRVYHYNIQSSSSKPPYKDYWITATPLEASPKGKNYCSTSDAVLRSEAGPPLCRPYTLAECEQLQVDDPGAYVPH